jgi:hypothetical protein
MSKYCYFCKRPISLEERSQVCIARLLNHRGGWAKDERGEELVAALCVACGHARGLRTVTEVEADLRPSCQHKKPHARGARPE